MTLREKAVGALVESIFQHNPALRSVNLTTTGEWSEHDLIPKQADAVIAAIEPDVRADERRKVLDELITMIEAEAEDTVWLTDSETMVDRLASLRTSDDTTTAFVASLTPHQRDYVRLCLDEERAEASGEA